MKTTDEKLEMMPGDERHLLDHDYDGIRELDHPLPRWWLMVFYGTIVFALGYSGYYLIGPGPDGRQELAAAMQVIEAKRPVTPAADAGADVALVVAALKDQGRIAGGRANYTAKCAACHGANGEGGIGPNLTDDFWIHGQGSPQDVLETIRKGVAAKGMPPWEAVLNPTEQIDVTAFIRSLRGSKPPGAKAAQGDLREFQEL